MKNKNWKIKLGIFLMIFSGVFFFMLLIIPFMNFDAKAKVTMSTVSVVIGEIVFWSGGLLVGKELFTKYKSYLNPVNWFKKKSKETESVENVD